MLNASATAICLTGFSSNGPVAQRSETATPMSLDETGLFRPRMA